MDAPLGTKNLLYCRRYWEIERGIYVVAKALELGVIKPKNDKELGQILDEVKGIYPQKAIEAIRKRFRGKKYGDC
ncbi:MAG: hypothetical protein QMC80_07095 [Thermoplasmatales archaeon]|nr:hypothetical protein [Thermoplasmatales archaeon]